MPTVLELIHSCAELAGRFEAQTTTSDAADTSSMVCSKFLNSVLSASEFANFWVLMESGGCSGEMGLLTNSGLEPTTGELLTADTFSARVASGMQFSLYDSDRLPPFREGVRPGWFQIANQAAERVWFEDTLAFAGVSDQIHYTVDLTTYPWFTDDTRIIEIQYPTTATDDVPRVMSRDQWSWVSDGEVRKLRFPGKPFRAGETFTIKVNRPGNSKLKKNASLRAVLTSTAITSVAISTGGYYTALPTVAPTSGAATFTAIMAATPGPITGVTVNGGGVYTATLPPGLLITRTGSDTGWVDSGTQTAGFLTLSDECVPDVRIMRPTMMALAFKELAKMGAPGQSNQEWLEAAQVWEATAVGIKISRAPRDANAGVLRMRSASFGGRRY